MSAIGNNFRYYSSFGHSTQDFRCCEGLSDACRGWVSPRALSAGVGQASAEETAGRLGWVDLRAMEIVSRALIAVLAVSPSFQCYQASTVVYIAQRQRLFSHHDTGFVFERSD
jgi:hypothetical protein